MKDLLGRCSRLKLDSKTILDKAAKRICKIGEMDRATYFTNSKVGSD